jgi:hypothetical protein
MHMGVQHFTLKQKKLTDKLSTNRVKAEVYKLPSSHSL